LTYPNISWIIFYGHACAGTTAGTPQDAQRGLGQQLWREDPVGQLEEVMNSYEQVINRELLISLGLWDRFP